MRKSESDSITREDFETQAVHEDVVSFFFPVSSARCDLMVRSSDQESRESFEQQLKAMWNCEQIN